MSQEPVELHGVIAFPNPNGEREIRFIDSIYNELFKVPDGGSIIVTNFEGQRKTLTCKYIDDYHALIGGSTYHICQFAEEQERAGTTYEPKYPQPKETYAVYEIYQIKDIQCADYCFEGYDAAQASFSASHYRKAYAGMMAKGITLDDLFARHNEDYRPFGRRMRSMSVSDVVVVRQAHSKKAYYVEPFGFRDISSKFLHKQKGRGDAR